MSTPSIESILSIPSPSQINTEQTPTTLVSSQLKSITSLISGGKNTHHTKINTSFVTRGQISTFAQKREEKQQNRRKPDSM